MRTLISAFAGLVLLAGVASQPAMASDVQANQPQRTILVTAGQGGSMTIVLPQIHEQTATGPAVAVATTAGQGGSITVVVPSSVEAVTANAPTNGATAAQMTLQPNEGIN